MNENIDPGSGDRPNSYIGKSVPRRDTPSKVNGSAQYAIDVKLPGMVYASALHSPVHDAAAKVWEGIDPTKTAAEAESWNDADIKKIKGVIAVVKLPTGVAVVARTFEAAKAGREALKVKWAKAKADGFNSTQALAGWETVRSVLQHPRCQNCHPADDIPLQGDEGKPHNQMVQRGADGFGEVGARCTTCHGAANPPASYGAHTPPGNAKGWHMPPPEMPMVFVGRSSGELCEQIKDPARNITWVPPEGGSGPNYVGM